MTKPSVLRQSQVVGIFGPGAMLDLPTRSVLVGGLDNWKLPNPAKSIDEPALVRKLEQLLRARAQLRDGVALRLLEPPSSGDFDATRAEGIEVSIFPAWFVCDTVQTAPIAGRQRRGRRLIRWGELDTGQRRRWEDDAGDKHGVTPIRFVATCTNGHLQDVDWRWLLHRGSTCAEALWLLEEGTSASFDDLEIGCSCGQSLALREITQPGRLGACGGHRPWLGSYAAEPCGEQLRLLTRTATNSYFPQVATVISLPSAEDALTQAVLRNLANLTKATSAEMVGIFRMGNQDMDADLRPFEDAAVFECLERLRSSLSSGEAATSTTRQFKSREFDILASGDAIIGSADKDARLHAETLPSDRLVQPSKVEHAAIRAVVAVHRLREVSCLYGFTRLDPAPLDTEGFEDIQLSVEGAPIASDYAWLPAVERFGEGVFVHFDAPVVETWLSKPEVQARIDVLERGWQANQRKIGIHGKPYPGGAYVMLHGLSHALMTEIALDCGYPASSLKERIYALAPSGQEPGRYGILIYTAATGAQGTLGGLVAMAPRMLLVLEKALDRLLLCSNDPVCADHAPGGAEDERALLGAACHGCLLIAETSCEVRNAFLDRTLLVETVADSGSSFFNIAYSLNSRPRNLGT